jgi:3-oxoacyl-[acyl-carrier-protein] synthase III
MKAQIIGVGQTPAVAKKQEDTSCAALGFQALTAALKDSGLVLDDIDGLLATPSLAEYRFMYAHYYATLYGLLPK